MNIAIMQPYLFPYIGYWQLIYSSDVFVIYDDVAFIKKGYVNRNAIILNGNHHRFTLELLGASQNKLINDLSINGHTEKLIKTIEYAYKKTPYFRVVFPLIKDILLFEERNLAKFLYNSIVRLSQYMKIDVKFIISSHIKKNNSLKGEEKILHISKILEASHYVNPIGGQTLYDKSRFAKEGITLNFLKTKNIFYPQFSDSFVPNLSIIDVMMFNSQDEISELLKCYELI